MDNKHSPVPILSMAFLALVASIFLSLFMGAASLTISELWQGISGSNETARLILTQIRIPRTLATLLSGAALGTAGFLIQSVLHNPLSAPSIIGVNAGAGLGAVMVLSLFPAASSLQLGLCAFAGAIIAVSITCFIAQKAGASRLTLILTGVAVSALFTAGIDGMTTLFPDALAANTQFRLGGAAHASYKALTPALICVPLGLVLSFLFRRELEILSLGDETACSLGLNARSWRVSFLLLSCFLSAGAISAVGLIGFVGLIVPHMARLMAKGRLTLSLPLSALLGATLTTLCDILCRVLFSPFEIPLGIVLSFLGAPFFLYLMLRRHKNA